MSNWEKVTPRLWRKSVSSPARFFTDLVEITLPAKDTWELHINKRYIATFPSWDEASQAAPMLYQLHKDSK